MPEDANRIHRFVRTLVVRQRVLLGLRVLARTAALLLGLIVVMVAAAVFDVDRGAAALVAALLLGVGVWIAAAMPLLFEWNAAGDALQQARRVEQLKPELRGRLITAVDQRPPGPDPQTDTADGPAASGLVGLVVTRAARVIDDVQPHDVHDAKVALRWLTLASVAWLVGLPAMVALSGGPSAVASFWLAGPVARAEVMGLDVAPTEETARVGDLLIRYTYPDYTGLEPKEVPNSTGDVQAPPGTLVEVTARTASVVDAAGLVAYDEALEATLDDGGRSVAGRFSIRPEPGTYRLVLYDGSEPTSSRDFAVEPQEDLPPEVMLDVGKVTALEVAVDDEFELNWLARDDYGVNKVVIAVDGKDSSTVLMRPQRRRAEVQGRDWITPRKMGLAAGSRVRLSVAAWDNDTVSGSKRGQSMEVDLVVLGPRGLDARARERRDDLLKLMIPILARFLTEPWPAGATSGELASWGETVAGRYEPFVDAVEQYWSGMSGEGLDRDVARSVVDSGRDLVRFTQVSFEPGSVVATRADSVEMTSDLRTQAIEALEEGILAFHRMRRNQALADLSQQAGELENMAKLVEELLERDADTQELLARLDQLERMMQRLAERAAMLEEGGLKEFLNTRENEAKSLMDEIREAIARGELDDARTLMERLSKLVGDMGRGIREELERRTSQGEQQAQQAEDLLDELRALEQEQRDLQQEVRNARQENGAMDDALSKLWDTLAARAREHRRSADEYVSGLQRHGRPFFERERAAAGAESAEELEAAISARDARGAGLSVAQGYRYWMIARQAAERERIRRGGLAGPGSRELLALQGQLEEIERLLDQLEEAEQQVDPETMERARELQAQQQDLDNRLRQAREEARALEQQFPVRPRGMQEALEQAGQRMNEAADDLSDGQLMQAEGSQGVASQRLQEAIEAIERAQEQAQQQAQQLQGGASEQGEGESQGEGGPNGEGQARSLQNRQLEIPGREEFQTPEAYRRALLEGMEGEVPEEYRAMKRRYYEELVHQ